MNVISRRRFIHQTTLATAAFLSPRVAAQSPDAWPQFRGNPTLTGVSSTTINPQLKQMWAVTCGEIIESSAAILDGVAYVGAGLPNAKGAMLAIGLWDGHHKCQYCRVRHSARCELHNEAAVSRGFDCK